MNKTLLNNIKTIPNYRGIVVCSSYYDATQEYYKYYDGLEDILVRAVTLPFPLLTCNNESVLKFMWNDIGLCGEYRLNAFCFLDKKLANPEFLAYMIPESYKDTFYG